MIPGVPYDAEIEYLESTGTQWIDTGVVGNGNFLIDVTVQLNVTSDYSAVFGSRKSSTENRLDLIFKPTALGGWFGYGNSSVQNASIEFNFGPENINYIRTFQNNKGSVAIYYQGTAYSQGIFINQQFSTPTTIKLFCNETNGVKSQFFYGKVFSVKFYDNGLLVRDFIPVRVGQTGYLYDRVSRRLFGNKGTGSFVLGPDVAKPVMGLWGMRKFYAPGELPKGYTKHSVLRVTGDAEYRSINTFIRPENSNDFSIFFNRVDLIGYSPAYACVGTIAENVKTPTGIGCFFVPPYRDVHITSGTNDSQYKTPYDFPVVNVSIEFGVKDNKRYFKIVRLSDEKTIEYSWSLSGNEHGTSQSSFLIGVKKNWWDNCTGTVLGRCRIISGDKLTWDGTPCSRDSDGVPGYWDSISRGFCPGARGFEVYDNPAWEDA